MKTLVLIFALIASGSTLASDIDDARAAYERGDYAKAMTLSLPLAEAGDGDMLANVGNMYGFGWGVAVDESKALAYWRKAAERHVPTALGNIAVYYMLGKGGLVKDEAEAASWYIKASEHRHVMSMITLSGLYDAGVGVSKDKHRALAWAGLAVANAPNEKVKDMARYQLRQAARGANATDMSAAQALTFELIKIIDANVVLYKAGA